MKKISLILLCFGLHLLQAQTFEIPKYAYPFGYDSTMNDFNLGRMEMFVGQKLVVLPLCSENESAGYPFFFRKPPAYSDFDYDMGIKVKNPAMVYEANPDNPFVTSRKVLENKNFLVVGTERVYDKVQDEAYFTLWILENMETKTRLYYGFPSQMGLLNHGVSFPFVVYGFYEKFSAKWTNRAIISTQELHYNDIENGNPIKISKGEEFVTEKALFSPLDPYIYVSFGFLVTSVGKKKHFFVPLSDLDIAFRPTHFDKPDIIPFIAADLQSSAKVEKEVWDKIFSVGICEGMSKELVRAVLGSPDNITIRASAKSKAQVEQWGYGLDYNVVFSNGKVTYAK